MLRLGLLSPYIFFGSLLLVAYHPSQNPFSISRTLLLYLMHLVRRSWVSIAGGRLA
ncbi:hypothetical protein T440DRAFT_52522 [Plenodomus tracheiphilus IPT5]|uniref:Uncharacterized protein n=1 Tax=Plenodomus tracheiphilus IPT5 TaxID=1408161 RepID=A0A6A7ALW0_9PLEO|nr:hypothetical protein T440DRAFT_52522 [Plenodomus tracheiphilus IPT5]